MWQGCWAALSTLNHYVQECASVLAAATLPQAALWHLTGVKEVVQRFGAALTVS